MPEERFAGTFNKAVNIELNKIPGTEEKLKRIKSSLNNSDEKDKSLIS